MRESLVDRVAVERLLLLVGALRSGLVDALAGPHPLSAEQVAATAQSDLRATTIVLEALSAEELVECLPAANGRASALYRLTPPARAHLIEEGPDLERASLIHQANKMRGWLELDQVIRTGKPAPKDPGRRGIHLRSMVSAMGEREPEILGEIVERCFAYAGDIHSMVDIGGAVGHLAREFARRGVKTTLFDREETLPIAREFLGHEAAGIAMVGGDLTEALPSGPFDLVYFGNVLHIYSPETKARVLREALQITAPGGTLAVQEYVRGLSHAAAMFAVNMLRSTEGGGISTEQEHRQWLSDAGFEGIEVQSLDTAASQLILARAPR